MLKVANSSGLLLVAKWLYAKLIGPLWVNNNSPIHSFMEGIIA